MDSQIEISHELAQAFGGGLSYAEPTDIDGVKAALRFLRWCKSKGVDKAVAIAWLLDEAEKVT